MNTAVEQSPNPGDLWWDGEFARLSPRARRHLPFIGLFLSSVAVETLEAFVASGDRQQALYLELVGEALDAAGWEDVLDEAVRGGLLLAVHRGLYELIPAVSAFLRRRLIAVVGPTGLQQLGSEFAQFYAAWAAHLEDDVVGGQEAARRRVALEEPNLLRALPLDPQVTAALAGLLHALGEEAFVAAWRAALPEAPPLEALRP